MSFIPYPDQQVEIDKMILFLKSKSYKKEIYVYPTSYGKSILIANVAAAFPGKWFINIVPKKELLEQNYEKYTSYGYKAGICSASLGKNELEQVLFATIGTLKKHIDFFSDKEVVIVHDECHTSSLKGSQLDLFVSKIKKCKMIGLTATPLRLHSGWLKMMNRMRDCFYTSIGSVVQIQDVVSRGRWTSVIYDVENLDESMLELNTTGNDYTKLSLKLYYEKNDIVSKSIAAVEQLLSEKRKSIIVYFASIKEAVMLADAVEGFEVLHGKTSKRERTKIIKDFKSGKLIGISNVGVLIEGLDHPPLSGIVMSRPTNSLIIWYQIVGRLVRKMEGKVDAKIIDLSGCFNKFGKVEDISFENNPYRNGYQAWSLDKMLTGYSLLDGHIPKRSQEIARYEITQKRKENALLNADRGYVINFGKFQGKTVAEAVSQDEKYMKWTVLDSGWSFSTQSMKTYRNEVINYIGVKKLFDMSILVLADTEFSSFNLFVEKVNYLLSSNKRFIVYSGLDGSKASTMQDYLTLSDRFTGIRMSSFFSSKVDGAIVFHNGSCIRTKQKIAELNALGTKVKVITY